MIQTPLPRRVLLQPPLLLHSKYQATTLHLITTTRFQYTAFFSPQITPSFLQPGSAGHLLRTGQGYGLFGARHHTIPRLYTQILWDGRAVRP